MNTCPFRAIIKGGRKRNQKRKIVSEFGLENACCYILDSNAVLTDEQRRNVHHQLNACMLVFASRVHERIYHILNNHIHVDQILMKQNTMVQNQNQVMSVEEVCWLVGCWRKKRCTRRLAHSRLLTTHQLLQPTTGTAAKNQSSHPTNGHTGKRCVGWWGVGERNDAHEGWHTVVC